MNRTHYIKLYLLQKKHHGVKKNMKRLRCGKKNKYTNKMAIKIKW